jgi:hypothetical protein
VHSVPQILNVELLIKLMGMTTSTIDGEALAAIRAANRLLITQAGGSWDTLLRGKLAPIDPFASLAEPPKATPRSPPPPPPPPPPPRRNRGLDKKEAKQVSTWIVVLEYAPLSSFNQTEFNKVEADWRTFKSITQVQYDWLKNTAARYKP